MQTSIQQLTPITQAASRSLTTAARAKSQAESLANADPDVLAQLIGQVSDLIASYCNIAADNSGSRTFARESLDENILILRRVKAVWVSRSPAVISSISINAVTQDLDDFVIEQLTGAIRCKSGLTGKQFEVDDEIIVSYTAGFVTPEQEALDEEPPVERSLPLDLEAACILAVQQAYAFASRETFDLESKTESTEDMGTWTDRFLSLTKAHALPVQVTEILDASYRRLS